MEILDFTHKCTPSPYEIRLSAKKLMNKPNYAERRLRVRATLDFLLNDWLKVGDLSTRPRFSDHSTGTFGAALHPKNT